MAIVVRAEILDARNCIVFHAERQANFIFLIFYQCYFKAQDWHFMFIIMIIRLIKFSNWDIQANVNVHNYTQSGKYFLTVNFIRATKLFIRCVFWDYFTEKRILLERDRCLILKTSRMNFAITCDSNTIHERASTFTSDCMKNNLMNSRWWYNRCHIKRIESVG